MIPVRCPRYVTRRYLTGKCHILALQLHEKTGFPLWGMFNAHEGMEHVFVYNPASGQAIDIRGAMDLQAVPVGSALEGRAPILRETDTETVTRTFGHVEDDEVQEAEEALDRYFHRLLAGLGAANPMDMSP